MSNEELSQSKAKLRELEEKEEKVFEKAQVKNDYEGLIYSIRHWLDDSTNDKFVLEDEREEIIRMINDVFCSIV